MFNNNNSALAIHSIILLLIAACVVTPIVLACALQSCEHTVHKAKPCLSDVFVNMHYGFATYPTVELSFENLEEFLYDLDYGKTDVILTMEPYFSSQSINKNLYLIGGSSNPLKLSTSIWVEEEPDSSELKRMLSCALVLFVDKAGNDTLMVEPCFGQ